MNNTPPREVEIFRTLVGARMAEQAIVDLNDQGVLHDHHSGLGHEAVGVGIGYAVRSDDCVQPYYRSGMALAHARGGISIRDGILSEIAQMHMQYAPLPGLPRVVSILGLIGSWMPMAIGVAMADQLRGKDTVTITSIGDGGANEGAIHEAMNIAGARKLPVVFIIENNGLAVSMPFEKAAAVENLSARAQGYGMPGVTIDGNDVLAVNSTVSEAVERARAGEGPTLVEAKVTRWSSHADGIGDLRTETELAKAREQDCVKFFRARLIDDGVLTEDDANAIEEECRREVETAVKDALDSRADLGPTMLDADQARALTYAL